MYTILGVIARPLGCLLGLLYDFISYYGITIILFTLIVKLCLYPLYIKQTKSMAKMSAVQPKMQAIQRKYANDRETMNIKMAELYKEEKFNPMGGCLPMLIQMPIQTPITARTSTAITSRKILKPLRFFFLGFFFFTGGSETDFLRTGAAEERCLVAGRSEDRLRCVD